MPKAIHVNLCDFYMYHANSKSNEYSFPFRYESESCSAVSYSVRPNRLYSPWNSPGQNTGVGRLSLL